LDQPTCPSTDRPGRKRPWPPPETYITTTNSENYIEACGRDLHVSPNSNPSRSGFLFSRKQFGRGIRSCTTTPVAQNHFRKILRFDGATITLWRPAGRANHLASPEKPRERSHHATIVVAENPLQLDFSAADPQRRRSNTSAAPSPAVDDDPIATILTGPVPLNRSEKCERGCSKNDGQESRSSDADRTSAYRPLHIESTIETLAAPNDQ
jgi:hypothetical protein